MKTTLFLFAVLYVLPSQAQISLSDSVNNRRERLEKTSLIVLGSWSVLNIGTGLVGQANSTGVQKQFYRANAIWGGVNLAISGLGYLAGRAQRDENSFASTFKKQQQVAKLFLVNTALDLGYIAFGLYTRERAYRFSGEKADRLRGTGNSMLLQGSFLAVFDGVLYLLHTRNGAQLQKKLQQLNVFMHDNQLGFVLRF